MLPPGPPIHVDTAFNIAQALSDLNAACMAREDDGLESKDERNIKGSSSSHMSTSLSAPTSGETPSAPQPAYPSHANNMPAGLRPKPMHKQVPGQVRVIIDYSGSGKVLGGIWICQLAYTRVST
jgi:hypothetical protein